MSISTSTKKEQIIAIRFQSFDHLLIDKAARTVIETAKRTGAEVRGPIPLPKKIKRITILNSPHIDSDARDQYEIITYKRLVIVSEPTPNTVDALMKVELAAGVDVQIQVS